jgi:hypothetical protein
VTDRNGQQAPTHDPRTEPLPPTAQAALVRLDRAFHPQGTHLPRRTPGGSL